MSVERRYIYVGIKLLLLLLMMMEMFQSPEEMCAGDENSRVFIWSIIESARG